MVSHGFHVLRKKGFRHFIDKLIYVIAIFGPFLTLPQIIKIWYFKETIGVSFLTWMAFTVMGFVWLLYGLAHKEKPIIVNNIIWIIMEILVLVGLVVYG